MDQSPSSSSAEQMSFEEAMSKALAVEEAPAAPEPVVAAPVPEPAPAQAPALPGVGGQPAPAAPEPAAPEPAGLRALMAREADLLARETEYRTHQADIKAIAERLDAYEADKRAFHANPTKFIRSLAPDAKPGKLAEDIWYDDLGDAAPKDYTLQKQVRELRSDLEDKRKQDDLRAKSEAEAVARKEAETAMNQYATGLREAIPALDGTQYRLVKSLAAQNADLAIRMMLDAASYAAQENRMLTAPEAAAAVEQYLAQFSPLYAPPPAPVPVAAPDPVVQAKAPPSTLRNSSASVQPSRAPADPADIRVLRRNALIAAGLNPDDPGLRGLED